VEVRAALAMRCDREHDENDARKPIAVGIWASTTIPRPSRSREQ
jgi:hypothetical protein